MLAVCMPTYRGRRVGGFSEHARPIAARVSGETSVAEQKAQRPDFGSP